MALDEKKFEEFLRNTAYTCSGYSQPQYNKPSPIILNLDGWKSFCPKCFSLYKNNGRCSNCGMELAITFKR